MRNVDFLLGVLTSGGPPFVTSEDGDGPHGDAILRWQGLVFIGREPGRWSDGWR
jgi:hypothetical protein